MIISWYPLFVYLKERMIGAMRQGIDIHAHILPGVDDGAADWAEAEAMLQEAERQGIRCIIATPHYRPGQNRDVLAGMAEELNQMAQRIRPDMLVCLGQEILYFEGMEKALRKGEVLSLAGSRYVLVEFAPSDPWGKLERAVRQLIQAGYIPVIAHWERYGCLYERGRLEELIRTGAMVQMNYRSLEGSLIKGMTNRRLRWRRKMVLKGNIHFLSTDMHSMDKRPPRTRLALRWLARHDKKRLLRRLTWINARHILEEGGFQIK